MECFICGNKEERAPLFGAIVREGVVKICESCSIRENIPVIKRVNDLQLKESEKNQTVYEKLSKMAGVDPVAHKAKFGRLNGQKSNEGKSFRKIVEEGKGLTFPELKEINSESKGDLIRNYHWAIFKARRARKLTQKQLSEAIGEPEASVKLVERGVLPDDYVSFIKKLQSYLGIVLFIKPIKEEKKKGFDPFSSKELLDETNENAGKEIPYWKRKLGFLFKKKEKIEDESDDLDNVNLENIDDVIQNSGEVSESERIEKLVNENSTSEKSGSNQLTKEDMDKIIFGEE